MTYKQIETARQTRLMITEVVIPVGLALVAIDHNYPQLKYNIRNKAVSCKYYVKGKVIDAKNGVKKLFKKDEESI